MTHQPRVSVFTPSHRPTYLDDCFHSLVSQTYRDWEWVVVLNNGAEWSPPEPDPRVRVLRGTSVGSCGASKRETVSATTGELLVELDSDDVLLPNCLAAVVAAFDAHPEAVMVYSDYAMMYADGSPASANNPVDHGWISEPEALLKGPGVPRTRVYTWCHSPDPTPNNIAWPGFQPYHVRAFRRTAYEAVGGYDASMQVTEDIDLTTRLYLNGDFHHLRQCLYLWRRHDNNTTARVALAQLNPFERYWDNVGPLAQAWANRRGLRVIDLAHAATAPLPPTIDAPDSSVGAILATDVLHRLSDPGPLFAECYRALAPNGLLLTRTRASHGEYDGPGHLTHWNEDSFLCLVAAPLRDVVYPQLSHVRFQVSGMRTYDRHGATLAQLYPFQHDSDAGDDEDPRLTRYVAANLIAVKGGGFRDMGQLMC